MAQDIEMNVSVNEVSSVVRELQVEIPWETVSRALERRYSELQRSARPMRGFRPGKAPRWLLEQQFGPIVQAEVAKELVSEALLKAFQERDLSPVATPEVDPGELRPGQPFTFSVRAEVRPEITEIRYEGLEVVRPVREATDDEVNEQVGRLREDSAAVRAPVPPRPAQAGDVLTVGYEVRLPDKQEPERTVEDQEIELGKGALLEKVEEALLGTSPGDEKDVEVEFPDLSRPDEEVKRRVLFHLRVKDVREKVLPEMDDAWARDVSEHETLLALRLDLRRKIEDEIKQAAEGVVRDRVIDALVEANPIEVPPSLAESQARDTEMELGRLLQLDLEKSPLSEDQRGRISKQAERKVRAALLLSEVARREELEVDDARLERRIAEIAERSGQPIPKIKAELGRGDRLEHLRSSLLQEAVVDLLLSKANITDRADEKPTAGGPEGEPPPESQDGAHDDHA